MPELSKQKLVVIQEFFEGSRRPISMQRGYLLSTIVSSKESGVILSKNAVTGPVTGPNRCPLTH